MAAIIATATSGEPAESEAPADSPPPEKSGPPPANPKPSPPPPPPRPASPSPKKAAPAAKSAQPLQKKEIKNYLANANLKKDKLVKDLEQLGLKKKGSKDGRFMEFKDKKGRVRAKIHPPDGPKSPKGTKYDHLHIYDKKGRPRDSSLKVGEKTSPDVHIEYGGE